MKKRTILLGDYDTAAHGLWTLTAWSFPEPDPITNLINVPGRWKGPLDLSTALTDGEPVYGSRQLSVTLESSEGDRMAREARIREMINNLHGRRWDIVLPDDPMHYVTGRLTIQKVYNDQVHGSVQVTGVCDPWRYSLEEAIVQLTATVTEQTATLRNNGTLPVVPMITATAAAEGESISLSFDEQSLSLSAGVYELPDLLLTYGDKEITYSGAGSLVITYREAVL